MSWSLPDDISKEIETLEPDKKEKIFRYIMRENEVGRNPSRDELLEIIQYLRGKTLKNGNFRNLNKKTFGDNVSLENEKQPKEYLRIFNCTFCSFFHKKICQKEEAIFFKKSVNESTLCNLYDEHI